VLSALLLARARTHLLLCTLRAAHVCVCVNQAVYHTEHEAHEAAYHQHMQQLNALTVSSTSTAADSVESKEQQLDSGSKSEVSLAAIQQAGER
jgi:hypothetical protein